ncbi:MAG: C4-type zinc ribbon domain-containing protein [Actinomycetota bacterium]|nr:C4-type zinc ribbon domain-containing protein [Actinomycetota bacterium]
MDTALDQLAHRRKTVPELAEIDRLGAERQGLTSDRMRADSEVGDIDREQRKLEADIDQVRARAERDQQRMLSSTSPKEAEGLQHEITSLARRQTTLEDQLLDLMERREEADGRRAAVLDELERANADHDIAVAGRDEAFTRIDAALTARQAERNALAAEIPADLLALYERIRLSSGGTGAARLYRHRCEGCHLELSGGDLAAVRAAPDDEVLRCEECARILVRTAESAL